MRYTTLTVGDAEYKLRATASSITDLEKKLGGQNPLNILMSLEQGELPSVTNILLILYAALQRYHSSLTFPKVMDLYDDYVESGKTYTDLIPVLIDVFQVSGFFNKAPMGSPEEQVNQ